MPDNVSEFVDPSRSKPFHFSRLEGLDRILRHSVVYSKARLFDPSGLSLRGLLGGPHDDWQSTHDKSAIHEELTISWQSSSSTDVDPLLRNNFDCQFFLAARLKKCMGVLFSRPRAHVAICLVTCLRALEKIVWFSGLVPVGTSFTRSF